MQIAFPAPRTTRPGPAASRRCALSGRFPALADPLRHGRKAPGQPPCL